MMKWMCMMCITPELTTEDIWMIITEDMMICTDITMICIDMTVDMTGDTTETDIINTHHFVTDTADVKIQSGGYYGQCSFNRMIEYQ